MKNKRRTSEPQRKEQENTQSLQITRRKSQMTASDAFDYQKLCRSYPGLLPCTIEQEREELIFTYDIHEVKGWQDIFREKRDVRLAALLDVEKLKEAAKQYHFSLSPENLYYDVQGRAFVRDRDIYGGEESWQEEEFLNQYKAIIGCTLQKKYKFEDYNNGGMDLLKEDKFLADIFLCTNLLQISEELHREYETYRQMYRRKYAEVDKKRYRAQRRALALFGILAAGALALCGYLGLWERPYEQAVIAANEAYLQSDYIKTVEAMDTVEVARMNVYQKYILAVASVKCESFNTANQNNILNTISLNGDEKVMEYWIYINRLETGTAADIAMQLSSDQFLYYAYLKEKTVVENDASLSGEEKKTRLAELESKLEPLEKEYSEMTEE